MSRKMKGVAFDSSPYDDAKARFRHQTLLQDFQELQEEVEAARNKLETMKQRKLTLLGEVRFLRRRHKFLLENKSPKPPLEQEFIKPQYLETQHKKSQKDRIHHKKEATPRNLPPIFKLNEKGRVYTEKKSILHHTAPVLHSNQKGTQASNLNQRVRTYGGKEVAHRIQMPVDDPNKKERLNGGVLRKAVPLFDLNQRENTFSSKEVAIQSRAPVFDLNQISREEEETEEHGGLFSFEEPRKGLMRGVIDEQHNDLKLSACRNIGDASTSRSGKRKISWQDPVALRV